MDARLIERARTKAFLRLLVDRLGEAAWAERRSALVRRIQMKELNIDKNIPIESQLFVPQEDDIDWYILVAELAYDSPYSDCAYSSARVYPYAMAIGAYSERLKRVPNVAQALDKMLANNVKPETQLFELLTASFYLKNGFDVSFIPERSIIWPDGKTDKSPDLLVNYDGFEMHVECKRADKQTQYSQAEIKAWERIWERLSLYLLEVSPWSIVHLVFHSEVAAVTADDVIRIAASAIERGEEKIKTDSFTLEMGRVDRTSLEKHYLQNRVRANSPQHELLVFGDMDSNEKRSIATIPRRIYRPGGPGVILNIFIEEVENCVAAQWRCDHEISLERRSRHFKGLISSAANQFPPTKPGVVHIWYESVEGIHVEEMRRQKHIDNLLSFDSSGTPMLGTLIHAVNYYPFEDTFQWAETVQDFARIPNLMEFYDSPLMLGTDDTVEVSGATHWEQDKASKLTKPLG